MNRYIATAIAPLIDVLFFDLSIAAGASLQASHMAAFAIAIILNYLLKLRSTVVVAGRSRDFALLVRLLIVALLALFLRGGVLGLLTQSWGWPAQLAIVPAVAAGLAVTMPGVSHAVTWTRGGSPVPALAMYLIAYAFALRLVYLGSAELLPEEAYYWNYSRHLDIGYLDHPPMVAWLIKLGTAIFGPSEFGVRIGAVACTVLTSIFTYRLSRNLFGQASALGAVLLAQSLPFFFLSGMLMTPDSPLTAAWAACLYFLERALAAEQPKAWRGVGVSVGLGLISKYSIGLLAPVTLLCLLRSPESRRWWRRPQPYGAVLLALAIFSPVIIWNAQHEWASFTFQTSRRLAEAPRFALHRLIVSALILITPTGLLAVAAASWRGTPPRSGEDAGLAAARGWLLIRAAIFVPLAVFAVFSLRHDVKLDWTGAPWTAALPVMAVGMAAGPEDLAGIRAWVRAAWAPTLVTLMLIYGAGLHYLVLGLPGIGYGKHIELVPVGWREMSRQITEVTAAIRRETGAAPLIVGMDRYAVASELAFYAAAQRAPAVNLSSQHLFGGLGLMYERWIPAESQDGRTLLLVALDRSDLEGKEIASHVERLGPITEAALTKDGRIVRHYYYRVGYRYSHAATTG
jgi:dolichol-phosphate mannosyltransferase